jgi:hypothetical protein
MAALGVLLFVVAVLRGGLLAEDRPRIEIPAHRLALVRQTFVQDNGRAPTAEEWARFVDAVVDQEVLYQYALRLKMHEQPAAQRRLAQIAAFVDANPHDADRDGVRTLPGRSDPEMAARAVKLGLHHGDLVVRRILADGARRLIRAVVLTRQPNPAMVEAYLAANPEPFRRPARTRITHVAVDGFRWRDAAKPRAAALLDRLRRESITPEAAPALGDEPFVPSALPFLTGKDLQTRFGYTFEQAVQAAPEGTWSGPFPSRYGYHLVWVHERHAAYVPRLPEIRPQVEERFLDKVADEWLALRLQQLRAEFDIVLPEPAR